MALKIYNFLFVCVVFSCQCQDRFFKDVTLFFNQSKVLIYFSTICHLLVHKNLKMKLGRDQHISCIEVHFSDIYYPH